MCAVGLGLERFALYKLMVFFLIEKLIIYVCMICLHACMSMYMPDDFRGQKSMLAPLEPKFQVILSDHVGEGTLASAEAASALLFLKLKKDFLFIFIQYILLTVPTFTTSLRSSSPPHSPKSTHFSFFRKQTEFLK